MSNNGSIPYNLLLADALDREYKITPKYKTNFWQNGLKTAEQVTRGLIDGVSLGWADELNGVTTGLGYGLGSLNSSWNKSGESFSDAFTRGYTQGRDNRRDVLSQGLQQHPAMVGAAQMTGAIASPTNHVNMLGGISGLQGVGKALNNSLVSGGIAGLGTAEGNAMQQGINTVAGISYGAMSNKIAQTVGNNISYSPQNYTNGNLIQNTAQPATYMMMDTVGKQIINQINNYQKQW